MSDARKVGCSLSTRSVTGGVAAHPPARGLVILVAACLLSAGDCYADAEHVQQDDGLTVIKMRVTPADEPVPAFKHRLTFDVHERLPGNRPQWYLRMYPEQVLVWRKWRSFLRDDENSDAAYLSKTSVEKVDWERLESICRLSKQLIDNHLVPGSQRRDCDWGIRGETLRGPEAIQFLLPEFQASRSFARMANLQVRWAVSEGRYHDAIRYLRTEYQLGRDVAEEPFLVCGLIGIAITGIANGGMTDLIAAPDSPNLYWALGELPSPPVSVTEALASDLGLAERLFPVLADADSAQRTEAEWNAVWQRLGQVVTDNDLTDPGSNRNSTTERLSRPFLPTSLGLSGYTHAKQRMIDWGYAPDRVEAMPVGQVLTIYSSRVIRIASGAFRKASVAGLPFPEVIRLNEAAEAQLRAMGVFSDHPDREIVPIASLLLPAAQAALRADVRCARDVAALRVIEALRMHAARNESRFPRTLEDVTCVPVPPNPATDKPFLYHRDGGTAVLDLPAWEGFPGYSRRYELTIKN